MTVAAHKVQGYKGQLGYTPTSGGAIVVLAGLKEASIKFTSEELDATDHGTSGQKDRMAGLLDAEVTAKFDYIEGDVSQNYLMNAYFTRAKLAVTLFPEETAAASGQNSFVGNVLIASIDFDSKTNALEGLSVTLKQVAPGFSIVAQ